MVGYPALRWLCSAISTKKFAGLPVSQCATTKVSLHVRPLFTFSCDNMDVSRPHGTRLMIVILRRYTRPLTSGRSFQSDSQRCSRLCRFACRSAHLIVDTGLHATQECTLRLLTEAGRTIISSRSDVPTAQVPVALPHSSENSLCPLPRLQAHCQICDVVFEFANTVFTRVSGLVCLSKPNESRQDWHCAGTCSPARALGLRKLPLGVPAMCMPPPLPRTPPFLTMRLGRISFTGTP